MSSRNRDPEDSQRLIAGILAAADPEDALAMLREGIDFSHLWKRPEPQLLPVPKVTRGFRIRVDLLRAKPPIWRRIEVPGDITLPRLHDVLQAAMGWTDSHLHRFRTGNDRNAAEFLTQFDIDEGDEGMPEDGVRLDQVVAAEGDRLWYDYDFGDGWEHVLRVEKVLETPPESPRCIAGRLACPPEDCGGIWGYIDIADWVRADFAEDLRPTVFDSTAEGRAWLPPDWHPDHFDIDETNDLIAAVSAEPPAVAEELCALLELSLDRGSRGLRDVLALPAFLTTTEVSRDDAARLTEPFRILLEVIGQGADLTGAGYLKPADVEQIAQRTGITAWWIGKANREDLTWPVAELRAAARSVGLVAVRKGRIAPTRAAKLSADDPISLLQHVLGRLPLGDKARAEREAGWVTLAVIGSETPADLWEGGISGLMYDLGWRDGGTGQGFPPADNATLTVFRLLSGAARNPSLNEVSRAVAAAARSVVLA